MMVWYNCSPSQLINTWYPRPGVILLSSFGAQESVRVGIEVNVALGNEEIAVNISTWIFFLIIRLLCDITKSNSLSLENSVLKDDPRILIPCF